MHKNYKPHSQPKLQTMKNSIILLACLLTANLFSQSPNLNKQSTASSYEAFNNRDLDGIQPTSPYITTVKQLYADFKSGNIEGVLAVLSDEVEWIDPGTGVLDLYIGKRTGKMEVLDFFKVLNNYLEFEVFEPRGFVGMDNKVAVRGYTAGKSKTTGQPFATDWFMRWDFDEKGQVNFHQLFLDTDNIAQAIGNPKAIQTGKDLLAAMDADDFEGLKALVTEDFQIFHPNFPKPLSVSEFFEMQIKPFNAALSNMNHKLLEHSYGDNKLTMRGIVTAQQTGELMGIPATGNEIATPWLAMADLDDQGRIKTLHVQFNQLAFLAQLGVNPLAKN